MKKRNLQDNRTSDWHKHWLGNFHMTLCQIKIRLVGQAEVSYFVPRNLDMIGRIWLRQIVRHDDVRSWKKTKALHKTVPTDR